jgi:hypothetical protein
MDKALEQKSEIVCPNCGQANCTTSNFCEYCGVKLCDTCPQCWMKEKKPYNCGQEKCPGYRLLTKQFRGKASS